MLYLGISSYGIVPGIDASAIPHAVISTSHDDVWCRVHNMTLAHAVLYVSAEAVQQAMHSTLGRILERAIPFDVGLAELQGRLDAYARKKPMLFQTGALQPGNRQFVEAATTIELADFPAWNRLKVVFRNREQFLRLVETDTGRWAWRIDASSR